MSKKRSGEPKREITHHLYLKDLFKFFKYEKLIRQSIDQKKDVSHWLLKNYFKLLDTPFEEPVTKKQQKAREKSLDKKKEIVTEFFKDKKQYQFEVIKKWEAKHGNFSEEYELKYSLDDFLFTLFLIFKEDLIYPVTEDKTSLIQYVYSSLVDYLKDSKHNPLSNYAICAITGAVVMSFGLLMTEQEHLNRSVKSKKQGYTEYLSDSVKYVLKKKK